MRQKAEPGEQEAEPGEQEGRMTVRDAETAWARRAGQARGSRPVERVDPYDMPHQPIDGGDAAHDDPSAGALA
jgi:hypothetical protein